MSSGRRSSDPPDHKEPSQSQTGLALGVDDKPSSSTGRRVSPLPTRAVTRPVWSTKRSTPRSERTGSRSPNELSDEFSDDGQDDSDELEETGDDATEPRELSSSVLGESLDVSGKELTYVLEVIQHPQRARACGFGDKDRRPLSPPPIVQLRIFDQLGNAISPLAVDFHRFIIMVDLWNADCTQQRSIVMHPGARQDQYSLFTHAASRPSSSHHHSYDSPQHTFGRLPMRSAPPALWQGAEPYGRLNHRRQSPSHFGHYSSPLATGPAPLPIWSPPQRDEQVFSRGHYPGTSPTSGYDLPSREGWYEPGSRHGDPYSGGRLAPPLGSDQRGWGPEHPSYSRHGPSEYASSSYRPTTSSASLEGSGWRGPPPFLGSRDRPHTAGDADREQPRPWSSGGESSRPRSSHGPLFTHVPSPISSHGSLPTMDVSPNPGSGPLYPEAYAERASSSHYSRVLVGSMGAVCQRLKGLDGQPGLFFFAHDLGIRTEGTFCLRFTLTDISSLCVPGVVKDQSTHMLARIFSNPFTVYSAKRFPGVLPTTELTQRFADQSVRLPTRQKRTSTHGNASGPGTRRKK